MDADAVFEAFARHDVDGILIGGMNFLLRHQPVLTFDIDFWVNDTDDNLTRVSAALQDVEARWGPDESSWNSVPSGHEWLKKQTIFCVTSPYAPIDIFREVRGLENNYEACRSRAYRGKIGTGVLYLGLSDEDMLTCQLAVPESERRLDRVVFLKKHLKLP